jgi:hypothetical protein
MIWHFVKDFRKRWDRQAQAFSNIFRQPQRVEKIASMIQRLVSRPPHESSHNFPPKFHQMSVFHQIWTSDMWHSYFFALVTRFKGVSSVSLIQGGVK